MTCVELEVSPSALRTRANPVIAALVAGLIPISPAVETSEGVRVTKSVRYSLMADVGTEDMPVLARTAKLAAVAKFTAAGPAADERSTIA